MRSSSRMAGLTLAAPLLLVLLSTAECKTPRTTKAPAANGAPVAPRGPKPVAARTPTPLASSLPRPPGPIEVPAVLRGRTPVIEPSGVVWVAALDRYIVVSDDIGDDDNKHAAWVLAMSRDGIFDAEPVPIVGVGSMNDGESICAGPTGTFFLTTSHSPNRKGKTQGSRRMLMLVQPSGRALQVIGRVDLTEAHGATGAPLHEIIGVDAGFRLDVEAITFRDGALLVGLKSPLSARNEAIVLQLADAAAVLRSGRIPDGALTRLWSLPLQVESSVGAGMVAQGIADLTFLPDGSVVLVANSPKGMPQDGGGALYWYRPGTPTPVLVHSFAGLKPEGITISEDGGSLVLVFDNDRKTPLWLRWPLQRPEPS